MWKRVGRHVARSALVVSVMTGLIAATPGTASAVPLTPADGYGFGQGAGPVYDGIGYTNRDLDAVAQTSASWLRVLVDWSILEPAKGEYNWNYLDNIVDGARARNLNVLGVITYTPTWARPAGAVPGSWTVPPADANQFAAFSSVVVQRYGDRISNWEIWNEPNLPIFFGFTDRKAQRYTALLKAAYTTIKAAQPNSTVIAGGLSRYGDDTPPDFLEQMYAAGAGGYFDAAAAHPYVFPNGLEADSQYGWSSVVRMHDVMVSRGDGDKKIWMTEIGAPTTDTPDGVTQQAQAKQVLEVMAAAAATGYSGPAFIYSIRDLDSSDRDSLNHNYGTLRTSDWKPKLLAAVLAK